MPNGKTEGLPYFVIANEQSECGNLKCYVIALCTFCVSKAVGTCAEAWQSQSI
ncbi:MAG: hypothetical protein ACI4M5_03640 [Christensenellales bacterium]